MNGEISEWHDESSMESTRVESWTVGERNSSQGEQERASSGSPSARKVGTGRMQDGTKEGRGLSSGELEQDTGAEVGAEEFEHGRSLALVCTTGYRGPTVLDERDGGALAISYEGEEDDTLEARKRGCRAGRGRGPGRRRGSKSRDTFSEEINNSLGNDNGRGRVRRGRGRGRKTGAVVTEETNNSLENNGGRGPRRGRGRGRGRGRDAVKPACDVEPQAFDLGRGGENASATQPRFFDERNCSVDSRAPVSGSRNNSTNSGFQTMLCHVRKGRGRGRGKVTGKRGHEKDVIFEAEEIREISSPPTEEDGFDVSGHLLEGNPISSRDDQVRVLESQPAGPKTTEMKNAVHSVYGKTQGTEERAFLTVEDGKGDREPKLTPDMEEISRMWLSEIEILSDWPRYGQLAATSPELRLKLSGGRSSTQTFQAIKLPLFKSAAIATSETVQEDGLGTCKDILLHVGGPVWALDWCPQRPGWAHTGSDKKEFLAVGAHPVSSPYNRMGACLKGKGLIQIWALDLQDYLEEEENQGADRSRKSWNSARVGITPRGRASSNLRGRGKGRGTGKGKAQESGGALGMDLNASGEVADTVEPFVLKWREDWHEQDPSARMVLGLTHEGLVTWDAKWQPVGESESTVPDREKLRLGFLAVVLGDGSLQVFDVPLPSIFPKATMSSSEEPLIVNMLPVFRCSSLHKRGYKSIPVSLEWSTWNPHDWILAGFHDASVGVWKFVPKFSATETLPLMVFQADSLPLRSVAWAPDGSGPQGRHLIVTAGHSGWVKFWDLRDIFRPIWDLQTSRCCISSMDWLPFPRCVLISMDDGTLRLLGIENASSTTPATGQPWRGTHAQGLQCYLCSSFAIWSVQVARGTGLVAYAGASGSVLQFQLTEKAVQKEVARAREPHYLCGAFAADSENGPLTLISAKTSEPVQMKKSSTEWGRTPTSKRNFLASCTLDPDSVIPSDSRELALISEGASKPKRAKGIAATGTICQVNRHRDAQKNSIRRKSESNDLDVASPVLSERIGEQGANQSDPPSTSSGPLGGERFPCRNVAVHRVRWNCNHVKRQWLAYGGAAGLVRCQQVYSMKKKKK